MILRLSGSRARGLVVVAALLVGLWLSFFGIRAAIARYDSEEETAKRLEAAVRLEPSNPDYWYILGRYQQYNLDQPDSLLAEDSYRKAIALNPGATKAWLDLATAYELDGKTAEARDAYLQAKKSYPVSAEVSWRYGNFLLRQSEQPQAYQELRWSLEEDGSRAAVAFSRAYRSNPNIDELLAQLLPPYPGVYVAVIAEALSEKQLAVARIVWARLLTLHPHLGVDDFEGLVLQLQGAGEFAEARRVWDQGISTMNVGPLFEPQNSVVWDPSFETGFNGLFFSWTFQPITQNVRIKIDKTENHTGRQSLRLSFDGEDNPNLDAACTFAAVEPRTAYRFSGWIKTRDLTTDQGIGFRIYAYGKSEAPPVNTKQIYGNNPFTLIEQAWTANPDIHLVKICITREPSDNPHVRISGTAWVDDVNLVPEVPKQSRP
jgi:tetratricopeptide (TPR) repeat protein